LEDGQWAPVHPLTWVSGYGGSRPRPPAGTFQGDGLLVLDPGNGDDVVTIGAIAADQPIPVVRCATVDTDRVIVGSAGACSVTRSSAARGIDGAKADFAEAFASASGVADLRPAPSIWSSWYQYFTEVTETDMDENLAAIIEREVPVDVVQLDDGYQAEIGDWLDLSNRFESLPRMVDHIRGRGLRAGIWIAPFLVGSQSRCAAEHPDWLVRDSNGLPVQALRNWGQDTYPLDITHPEVREHLARVFGWFTEIGIDLFKIDFVYAAALAGRRHDEHLTDEQVYRDGLDQVRAAIGPDAYLLGCGAPLLPSVGKVDGMRVSADTGPQWAPEHGDMSLAGGASAELSVIARSYQHGRYWVNDPDCLLVRPGIEGRERRADLVAGHGGVRGSSDRINALDGWGLTRTQELLGSVPAPTPFEVVR
jgi:alpha-galactosidase